MSTDRHESFLTRWSRRKRSGEPDADAKATADLPANAGDAKPEATAEPPFDLTKLPRIEDLTPTSDIAQFLQKGVPEELKRLALRRAWSLDPAIRDFVEVAENQYNWNVAGGAPGFGELDAGTDLKALLLQATGQLPEPRKTLAEAPLVSGSDVRSSTIVPAEQDGVAVSGRAGPEPATKLNERAPKTAPPSPRRAKHGGALAGVSGTGADDTSA